jgi:hypothetical protein
MKFLLDKIIYRGQIKLQSIEIEQWQQRARNEEAPSRHQCKLRRFSCSTGFTGGFSDQWGPSNEGCLWVSGLAMGHRDVFYRPPRRPKLLAPVSKTNEQICARFDKE